MLIAISGSQGCGKAQPHGSKVLTPTGWVNIEDLAIGDEVLTPSNQVSRVDGIFPQGHKQTYRFMFHDGSSTECCREHLWKISSAKTTKKNGKVLYIKEDTVESTQMVIDRLKKVNRTLHNKKGTSRYGCNVSIPLVSEISFRNSQSELPIPPYLLGVLIGDGSMTQTTLVFCTHDDFIKDKVVSLLDDEYTVTASGTSRDFRIVKKITNARKTNQYVSKLKEMGIWGCHSYDKFIPECYKHSSIEERWELFRGLMDTDGTVSKSGSSISYTSTSFQLAKDVQYIARSLGCNATISCRKVTRYTSSNKDKKEGRIAYDVHLSNEFPKKFFSLPRKKDRANDRYFNGHRRPTKRIVDVVPCTELKECVCISIEHPEHLYITDDFIVTHNTTTISALQDKGFRTIERKTSRSILKDWNVTLSEVNNDRELTTRFQDEILKRKIEDETEASRDGDMWFTERSFADLFTYATVAIGKDNEYSEWLDRYYTNCAAAQTMYGSVIYINGGLFPIYNDGVRAINSHYSRMVDFFMKQYTKELSGERYREIDFIDIQQRITFIEGCIKDAK